MTLLRFGGRLAFGLGALAAACAGSAANEVTPLPAPPVARAAASPAAPAPDGGDGGDGAADASATGAADAEADVRGADANADAVARAPLRVELERPFKLYERRRPKGEVNAAGLDEKLARWNLGGTGDPAYISNHAGFHPGARVRVDTRVTRGKLPKVAPYDRRRGRRVKVLSETSLLARSRARGYWPFRLCFEDGLRRDQTLHGMSELSLRIGGNGRVARARLVRTKLGDKAVAECLVDAAKQLPYLSPPRGRSIDVALTVKLWPGDAPVPLAEAPANAPENPGALNSDAVAEAFEATRGELEHCYEKGLDKDRELWGRVQVRIDQDEKGRVRRARQDESHFPDRAVASCVVSVLRSVAWPKPKGGALSFVVAARFGELRLPEPAETAADAEKSR